MFRMCYRLVGEQGTKYDNSHVDLEYARIDGKDNHPGYLSYKSILNSIPSIYGSKHDEKWFLLNGQRLDVPPTKKGIYIKGRKKILNR